MKEAWVINLEERPERLGQFRENRLPFDVRWFPAVPHEIGWKGCAQSHLEVLGQLTDLPAVVFEDDAELVRPWEVVEEVMKELPEDWDLLQLGVHVKQETRSYSENLQRLIHGYCTHAIIYGSWKVIEGIQKGWTIYEKQRNRRDRVAIDGFYYDVVYPTYNCYVVHPPVAQQRPGYSDIDHKHKRFKDYRKWMGCTGRLEVYFCG